MSAPDPAAKLQIERISRAGYSCARAGSGDSATGTKPSNRTMLLSVWFIPFPGSLNVQFWIMPEDALLVERDPPLRREIGGNARARSDALVQRDRPGVFRLQPLHRAGKSIAQTRDHLEKRQVRIGKGPAEEPAVSLPRQHPLEVAEEFRQPLGGEVRGAALRFGLLVLVVEGAPDRMMRIVRFDQPEPHAFSAALYRRPVIEFVAHGVLLQDTSRSGTGLRIFQGQASRRTQRRAR